MCRLLILKIVELQTGATTSHLSGDQQFKPNLSPLKTAAGWLLFTIQQSVNCSVIAVNLSLFQHLPPTSQPTQSSTESNLHWRELEETNLVQFNVWSLHAYLGQIWYISFKDESELRLWNLPPSWTQFPKALPQYYKVFKCLSYWACEGFMFECNLTISCKAAAGAPPRKIQNVAPGLSSLDFAP